MEDIPEAAMAAINHDGAPLTEEILTDILARLPAKSVGRFRCVSRAWRDMLSTAYFVDLHARRANRPGLPKLLLTPVGSSYDGYIYSWQPGGQVEKLMRYDPPGGVTVPLTKPCRGLILIWCTDSGEFFVCSPSTGATLPLPDRMAEANLGPARCEIVAFDVKSEEFEVLLGPPCRHDSGCMTILQLEGALCVSFSDLRVNTIDIWMMRDSGIWSVEYHIELQNFFPDHYSSENTTPLAVDPKDGRILLNTGCLLGYYEPKTATDETIYAADMALRSPDYKFCPIICHESLVYLPGKPF